MDDSRRQVLMAELKDATRERDQLIAYIEGLRARLDLGPEKPGEATGEEVAATAAPVGTDPLSLVYEGEFVGMSMPKAAETVLKRWSPGENQRPLKTTVLLAALRKGGLDIPDSRSLYRALWSASRFHNLKGGRWGFAAWYPAAARAKAAKHDGSEVEDLDTDAGQESPGEADVKDFPIPPGSGTPPDGQEVAAS